MAKFRTYRSRIRKFSLILFSSLFVLALAGGRAAHAARDTIRLRMRIDIISLDPAKLGKPSDHVIAFNLYDGLVRLKAGTAEIEPNLAKSWDLSPDGKTYTFHLRAGVKWHKGFGKLTAHDFKYTFERVMNPKTKSRYRRLFSPVKKITVVDDLTLKIELKHPFPSFLTGVLAFRPGWVVNKKAVEKHGKKYSLNPIGTGPYQFVRWVRGGEVVLKRNPDYYEPVKIENVIFKVIRKDSVARLALEKGDLDASYFFDGAIIQLIEKSGKFRNPTLPAFRTHWMGFNLRRKKLQDIRVRRAVVLATNKKAIADHVFYGFAEPVHSIINPNIFGYHRTEKGVYDPAKARQLLKEAGHPNGIDFEVLALRTTGWPGIIQVLKEQWKKAGIRIKITAPERAVYNRLRVKGKFDLITVAITRFDPDQYAYAFFHSSNIPRPNYSAYKGADDIIEAARKAVDDKKRAELYKKFAIKLAEDLPGYAVTNVHYSVASRKNVMGLAPTFMDSYPVRQMYFKE